MSGFGNVIGGKLSLKGKALEVKDGGMKKKKKKKQGLSALQLQALQQAQEALRKEEEEQEEGGGQEDDRPSEVPAEEEEAQKGPPAEDHRTPAEKRYHEQAAELEMKRAAKIASKSHRQKIEEFNKYLANMSEHYDIPKVGPG